MLDFFVLGCGQTRAQLGPSLPSLRLRRTNRCFQLFLSERGRRCRIPVLIKISIALVIALASHATEPERGASTKTRGIVEQGVAPPGASLVFRGKSPAPRRCGYAWDVSTVAYLNSTADCPARRWHSSARRAVRNFLLTGRDVTSACACFVLRTHAGSGTCAEPGRRLSHVLRPQHLINDPTSRQRYLLFYPPGGARLFGAELPLRSGCAISSLASSRQPGARVGRVALWASSSPALGAMTHAEFLLVGWHT